MNATDKTADVARAVPGMPRDDDGPVFHAPWEAQAFAMALSLHERGLFTWSEWAAMLGAEIKRAQAAGDPDTGETYYRHWLATLERMVAAKGVAPSDVLVRTRDAWDHAADRTPHGKPIVLKPEDFGTCVSSDDTSRWEVLDAGRSGGRVITAEVIVRRLCRIPRDFRGGSVSAVDLVEASGYLDARNGA